MLLQITLVDKDSIAAGRGNLLHCNPLVKFTYLCQFHHKTWICMMLMNNSVDRYTSGTCTYSVDYTNVTLSVSTCRKRSALPPWSASHMRRFNDYSFGQGKWTVFPPLDQTLNWNWFFSFCCIMPEKCKTDKCLWTSKNKIYYLFFIFTFFIFLFYKIRFLSLWIKNLLKWHLLKPYWYEYSRQSNTTVVGKPVGGKSSVCKARIFLFILKNIMNLSDIVETCQNPS